MSPIAVSDARSNPDDQVRHAARVLRRSELKRQVFAAIYRGKRNPKTVDELAVATGLTRKRVLDIGNLLRKDLLVEQTTLRGQVAYRKDSFYDGRKKAILQAAIDPKRLASIPSKTSSRTGAQIVVKLPKQQVRVRAISVDDIDSFNKVKRIRPQSVDFLKFPEAAFKQGVQRIIGEKSVFKDWGGERADLLTTRMLYRGRRVTAAIAFKGPGKKGRLTPAGLGKNGDQIQRLFGTNADLYLVQYWGEVAAEVGDQMRVQAVTKSYSERREVAYGVVDGYDSARLIRAYPKEFGANGSTK